MGVKFRFSKSCFVPCKKFRVSRTINSSRVPFTLSYGYGIQVSTHYRDRSFVRVHRRGLVNGIFGENNSITPDLNAIIHDIIAVRTRQRTRRNSYDVPTRNLATIDFNSSVNFRMPVPRTVVVHFVMNHRCMGFL